MRILITLCLLSGSLHAADPALKISVYATAGGIQHLMTAPESRQKAVDAMKRLGVSRVVLEGRRGDEYVSPKQMAEVRDAVGLLGLRTSGGIATVPGKNFGTRQNGVLSWLNWESDATRDGVARFFRENASVFDELVVDDFFCTADTGAESDKWRANRDWGQYRRDMLTGLIKPIMIEPARASRPGVRMVIKFPQWYDRFHLFGYDPPRMAAQFDAVWVGVETRNPETQRMGFVQPTQGYMNYRWLTSVIGEKKVEAAWFDHIECTGQNFVDQAWQSVLAGARELILFNLFDVVQGHAGHELFIKALPGLQDTARRVQGKTIEGVAFYKPPHSDPGSDRFLMDYLGMLGIPVVPVSEYPSRSQAVILGVQASHDPNLMAKVAAHMKSGARIAMTSSLREKIQAPKGVIPIDLRTFTEQDYLDTGEQLLPPKRIPWLDMDRAQVDAIRKNLGIDFSAPTRIAYYRFGADEALYSFRDEDTNVVLRGKTIKVPAHSLVWAAPAPERKKRRLF